MELKLFIVLTFIVPITCDENAKLFTNVEQCTESYRELSNLDKIKSWWNTLSDQKKILNCKVDPTWGPSDPSLLKLYSFKYPVYSYRCGPEEEPRTVSFRGKVVDGQLDGLGLLKLGKKILSNSTEVCLRVNQVLGSNPVQILGTFTNGLLEGRAKITLENGVVVMANYHEGLSHGLRREWDKNGNLTFVGFYFRGSKAGKCWSKVRNLLVYEDCSTFNRSDDESVVIPLNDSANSTILSGTYWTHLKTLVDVKEVQLVKTLSTENSCSLNLETEVVKKLNASFELGSAIYFPNFSPETNSLCNIVKFSNGSSSAAEKLSEWFKVINEESKIRSMLQLMRPDETIPQEDGAQVISDINFDLSNFRQNLLSTPPYFNVTIFGREKSQVQVVSMSFDQLGRPHGLVELMLRPEKIDKKFGFELTDILKLQGFYEHGKLQGPTYLAANDGRVGLLSTKNGIVHGPVFIMGTVPILPTRLKRPIKDTAKADDQISFIGRFSNGKPVGAFWLRMFGDGYMHGSFMEASGKATGDNLAYIYPDKETAYLGQFEDFVMKKAYEAQVDSIECNEDGIFVISKFTQKPGPIFYYEAPTNTSYGAGPPGVNDPYESRSVMLTNSTIPNSGQGVLAIRDIPSGQCACLYSGYLYDGKEQDLYREACSDNVSLSMDERRHCKKYSLGFSLFDSLIDIPPELDQPGMFQPTIGPKVNHHFREQNSVYSPMEHPRWGIIMCVLTLRPIKTGEELFTIYGYGEGQAPYDFPWYFELKRKIEAEEKLDEENKTNGEKKKKKKKSKDKTKQS